MQQRGPFVVLASWIWAASCLGAEPAEAPIGFDALQAKLGSAGLCLLDPRPKADFDAGHIPGAVWVDAKAAQAIGSRPGGLADRGAWETWLAPLGIGPDSEVVICDGARQLDAARLWWLLRYLGLPRVGLVDGNYPLWVKQGRPVATSATPVEPRPVAVRFDDTRHATRLDVLDALKSGKARVVDARSQDEYAGTRKMARRGGHVPEACRLEWSELVDADGRFLGPEATRARMAALGIAPGQPVITHCQGGGRASVDAFALERAGFVARNYYLGWSDWGNADDTPVVPGPENPARP